MASYSDLESEFAMKKKEEQLRKQIDATALPEDYAGKAQNALAVSYTHLRAHET